MTPTTRLLAGLPLLAWSTLALAASQPAPTILPSLLADIGGPANGCPVIIHSTGQSVEMGQDHVGPHNNPANTFITNNLTTPTGFVPAVYGTAPLNMGVDGIGGLGVTTSVPGNAYVNPADSEAWYLRQSGLIPASRPIVIVANWFPSKSITYWADQTAPFDLWSPVVTQYNLLNAGYTATAADGTTQVPLTYPGAAPCPINEWQFDQGQNDASGPYGSASAYLQAFTHKSVNTVTFATGTPGLVNDTAHGLIAGNAIKFTSTGTLPAGLTAGTNYYVLAAGLTANAFEVSATQGGTAINLADAGTGTATGASLGLIPKFLSLPNWSPQTRGDVAEMGTWAGETGAARNDILRTMDNGCLYPWLTMVSSAGLNQSTDNPGPHPDGYGEDLLGYRSFVANIFGRIGGTYKCPTFSGVPRIITVPATGYIASEDEVRNGVLYHVTGPAGSTLQLPNSADLTGQPIYIDCDNGCSVSAVGTLTGQNTAGNVTNFTTSAGSLYQALQFNGSSYFMVALFPRQGNQLCYTGGTVFAAPQTFSLKQLSDACYGISGTGTVTLTPGYGLKATITAASGTPSLALTSGSFTMLDGSTLATIPMEPGQTVDLIGIVTTGNALQTLVIMDTGATSPATQYSAPATGATVTSTSGFGHLTHVIDPAGTIAALTVTLPSSPRNGAKVTYAATQAVTAVTWAGGTLGIPQASFTAGQKVTLTYLAGQSKWY